MFIGFGEMADVWRPFLALLAVLTMTFGNLVAMQQRHLIRMLAYSSISQAGYMLLPLGVASSQNPSLNRQAMQAATVYLLIYAFMETGAFTTAIAFGRRGNGYMISDYAGLFARAPALATAMAVFLFSLAGVPPLGGWAAKFFVFRAVVNGGGYWLAVAMAINTVISLFYYAAVVRRMFFDAPAAHRPIPVPILLGGTIAVMAVGVVVIGILPEVFGGLASRAVLRL
jgi:NADH-quinone oxidoreductase subunit N